MMSQQNWSFDDILNHISESRKSEVLRKMIRHNNTCKIWVGGSENDKYDYPYRLVSADKGTQRIRDCAQELMLDSGISDPTITNEDVIQKAISLDAQWVIPKDYLGKIDETHESLLDFLELYEDYNCRSKIIVPIQPPHDEHYNRYEDLLSEFSHFAVGGMKDAPVQDQIAAVEAFREAAGPHVWVHGLGMGLSDTMLDALRHRRPFLNSLDASTFENLPGRYGCAAGKDWKQEPFEYPSGNRISWLHARMIEYELYQANYQLTPFANGFPDTDPTRQLTLGDTFSTPPDDGETDAVDVISPE